MHLFQCLTSLSIVLDTITKLKKYNAVKNSNLEKFDKSWSPYMALLN